MSAALTFRVSLIRVLAILVSALSAGVLVATQASVSPAGRNWSRTHFPGTLRKSDDCSAQLREGMPEPRRVCAPSCDCSLRPHITLLAIRQHSSVGPKSDNSQRSNIACASPVKHPTGLFYGHALDPHHPYVTSPRYYSGAYSRWDRW